MHRCPGCRNVDVASSRLACKPCWFRVPRDLRGALWAAFKNHGQGSEPHLAAMRDITDWYRQNPA